MLDRWVTVLAAAVCLAATGYAAPWTQFRGSQGNGTVAEVQPPTKLDEQSTRWTADLPGRGLSSPIVVGDKVFVTCSSGPEQKTLHLICFDDRTGDKVWERQFQATGRTMCHAKTCIAACSPASDGKRIFALFSSNDLFCVDLDGNLLWLRGLTYDYPNASNSLGMSSSPVVVDETLIVQIENDSESFAAGVDCETGMNRWKKDRPKMSNWTSPVVLWDERGDLVALQSGNGVDVVKPRSGEVIWSYSDGASTIPSSAVGDGVLYVPSHGLTALAAGSPGEAGKMLWRSSRLSPATASPLVWDDLVFSINRAGVLCCADCKDGEIRWQLRLKGPFSASPVAAAGHIYAVNEDGALMVVRIPNDAEKAEIVGELDLGQVILSTPAIANNALYVRSDGRLWKFANAE